MSFLGTAFLLALPLVAAPLLLHLFDRRRNTVIEWGAMEFLVEAAARKTSARKFKQWLLLLIRCLAIAMLVFALARPLVPAGYLGGEHRGETIFVVDNSMSMLREADAKTVFDEAVDHVRRHVATMPGNHRVRILTTAPYPVWASASSVRNEGRHRAELQRQLDGLRATEGRGDMLAALFTAAQAESDPTQSHRRIVVLTDGQASDWRLDDQAGWKRLRETLGDVPLRTEIETVRLDRIDQQASKGNLGIDAVALDRLVVGIGQSVTATAILQNYHDGAVANCDLVWSIDGQEHHRQAVTDIEGRQTVRAAWNTSFDTAGTYRLICRADREDDLIADNTAGLVVEVVDRIPIVIVEDADDLAEFQQDSYFVQAALGWMDGKPLEGRSLYVPTVVTPKELPSIDLSDQRVVVIPNFTRLDDDAVKGLSEFVEDGGGLWIGLGPRTDVGAFNRTLFADGNGLAPLALDRIVDTESSPASDDSSGDQDAESLALRIDPFREQHRAMRHVADADGLDLTDALIRRRFRFVIDPSPDAASSLLRLNNDEPLVTENFVGHGRVLVQAVPLRMQWSDLAKTQAFVVMVRDWIDYLAEPRATRYNLQPGEPLIVRVPETEPDGQRTVQWENAPTALLRMPQGDPVELAAGWLDDAYVFQSSRTRLPGEYQLEIGLRERAIPFHVQRSSLESELDPLNPGGWQRIAAATTVTVSGNKAEPANEKHSDPVWPYLLLGLIGSISGELVLSGILSRERFGTAGLGPETSATQAGQGQPPAADFMTAASPAVGRPLDSTAVQEVTS